jgi:cyclopropane-fatty-acyl-phospholipid synthase
MAATGATRAEIGSHYDRGDAFYGLWLGAERVYSCGLWDAGVDSLDEAQARKLAFHLANLRLPPRAALLDIGCGWGGLLRRARAAHGGTALGLTLSAHQRDFIQAAAIPGVEARLEDWTEHEPARPYDGIACIGAFEHVARPEHPRAHKAAIYSRFFERCHAWLVPGGRLSLQTICYDTLDPAHASAFMQNVIFPGSELPLAAEIQEAARHRFVLLASRDDAEHYARTCEAWLRNLQRNRRAAAALVGADTVRTYEHYLRLSAIGFRARRLGLLRLLFERSAAP